MEFLDLHFPKDIVLTTIRWYLRYSLSYRDVEELKSARGIRVDHSAIIRWVVRYALLFSAEAQKHKRKVGISWRLDETYIKVRDQWKYLYRAVDKEGDTVDFLLTAKRNKKAALRFFRQAVCNNGTPVKLNIDKSGANPAAILEYNKQSDKSIEIRQCKYLNNIIVQDHRRVKRNLA